MKKEPKLWDKREKLEGLPKAGNQDFVKARNDVAVAKNAWKKVKDNQEWKQWEVTRLTQSLFENEGVAETYDEDPFTNFMFIEEYPDMMEMLDIQPWDDVLDIGCGTGKYIGLMQQYNPASITGVDISQSMLNQAREKYKEIDNISFKQGNIETWLNKEDFPDNSKDCIICPQVLKFIVTREWLEKVFKEFYRILRPWWRIVFSNNHPKRNFERDDFILKTNDKENEKSEEEWESPRMKVHTLEDYEKASQAAWLKQEDIRHVCISERTAQLFEPESYQKLIWWEKKKVIVAMKLKKPLDK